MRNRVLALIVIISVLFGAGLYLIQINGKRTVQINIPSGRPGYGVDIYRAEDNSETAAPESFINPKNLVKELSASSTVALKQGSYVVANKKNVDYAAQVERFTLTDTPITVNMSAAYSDTKLSNLLKSEQAGAQQAFLTAFPALKDYAFVSEKLFQNGEWYGGMVTVKLSPEQARLTYVDKYHLIAHKVNGKWVVATTPPELVLSRVIYPDIPVDILREVNKL